MKKIIAFFILLSVSTSAVQAQDFSQYQKKWLVQDGDTLPYRVLFPKGYDSTQQYPVLFFLHGAGERGNDNEQQMLHGAKLFLKDENFCSGLSYMRWRKPCNS